MKKSSPLPINSIAVVFLAVAVILLAIKEPRCDCEHDSPRVEMPTTQQASPTQPSIPGRQRELRKF